MPEEELLDWHKPLAMSDCYVWHNIPFTENSWPNQYLPVGYSAADASRVWGMPMNFQFSAMGWGIMGCDGEDPWQLATLIALIDPPEVAGIEAIEPTSTPSPFTAEDGGFNFYTLKFYAEGPLFDELSARGWHVEERSFDLDIPPRTDMPVQPLGTWYGTADDANLDVRRGTESWGSMGLSPDAIWNHRNFAFRFYHETPTGTGALVLNMSAEHLLVGPATCDFADGDAHEIFAEMPYLPGRTRTRGDCPDDTIGAIWIGVDATGAHLVEKVGVYPA